MHGGNVFCGRGTAVASPSLSWGMQSFGEAYLAFDTFLVIISHPLVALGSVGDLLGGDSMDCGSMEEVTDLNREERTG